MKEQFSSNFRLNKVNTNLQNNFQVSDNEDISDIKFIDLFNFNGENKFVLDNQKNETEYLLLSSNEKDTTKQIEKEIKQIKNFEEPMKDYFNF